MFSLQFKPKPKHHSSRCPAPLAPRVGFSLVEVIVALFITLMVVLAAYSIFQLALKTKPRLQNRAEIVQNMRAVFDRFSRELRQANAVVTTLPANEVLFEDGHGNLDNVPLQYLRYHLVDANLYREVSYYAFSTDPSKHVHYNDLDVNGNLPSATVTEDQLIGEYLTSLSFTLSNGDISITATFNLNPETLTLTAHVAPRNLN